MSPSFKHVIVLPLRAAVIALLLTQSATAAAAERDKDLHFGVSAGISAASYLALREGGADRTESAAGSLFLTLLIGAVKESLDPVFDRQDMEANLLGAVSGILLTITF